MARNHYWTPVRLATGTAAWVFNPANTVQTPALRDPTDSFVRAIFHARISMSSLTTPNPTPVGWSLQARVRLMINWDPTAAGSPDDVTGPDNAILGFCDLQPAYYPNAVVGGTVIDWMTPPEGVDVHGQRRGNGTDMPQVLSSIYTYDANGVFLDPLHTYSTTQTQTITGRILWASDF
jgi:hypothetical protein